MRTRKREFSFLALVCLLAFATGAANRSTAAEGEALVVTSRANREIRFKFGDGPWTEFQVEDGEVTLRRTEDGVLLSISTVENCRAGGAEFLKSFARAYRRGRILENSAILRPGSVLVEDLSSGTKTAERFDRTSAYARHLLYLESEMSHVAKSPVTKCKPLSRATK